MYCAIIFKHGQAGRKTAEQEINVKGEGNGADEPLLTAPPVSAVR